MVDSSVSPRRAAGVALHAVADGHAILKDARGRRYVRLTEEGVFLWRLLDGRRTLADLSVDYFHRYRRLGGDVVAATVRELAAAGLVEAAGAPSPNRGQSWARRTFSLPDPDRALSLLYRLLRPLWLRPAQLALLLVALAGAVAYGLALDGGVGRGHTGTLALAGLVGLEVQVFVHELGHALTTKHFGREVHSAGVGWYLLSPVAFVDTSDMWLERRTRRIVVAAAGPYANVVLSGAAGCLLPLAGGAWRTELLLVATTGYWLALLNLNPLYELDGYYVLSDWLGVPNLRAKALAFLGARLRGRRAIADRRLVRVYAAYGTLAAVYALAAAAVLLFGYQRLLERLAAHVLPVPAAAAVGAALAASLAGILLCDLARSLRRT